MKNNGNESSLDNIRVLDLTEGGPQICGKILGDLGADVIKIEPPGGSHTRRIGPFYKDIPDLQKSLFWFAYNTSKRGITLDIETQDGQQIFKRLTETADIVIESFAPGYLDKLGIGYQSLNQFNPGIIMTSITPFGQTGPKSQYISTELTNYATNDGLYITGDLDGMPVWISYPQPSIHAGVEACIGALIAHWHKVMTGQGQHVDTSVQDTFINQTEQARIHVYEFTGFISRRSGDKRYLSTGVGRRQLFVCSDGAVAFEIYGGSIPSLVQSTINLVQWMAEEDMAPDWLVNYNWVVDYDTTIVTQDEVDRVEGEFAKFFMTKTKAELFDESYKRGVILAPVNTAKDICESEHLKARNYWTEVKHDELNATLTYCGLLNNSMSKTPGKISRRAPLIGEHNLDIYEGEMGYSREEVCILMNAGII
ncbi:MAG: CoA transferase [Dehalococcoidia bacterium]